MFYKFHAWFDTVQEPWRLLTFIALIIGPVIAVNSSDVNARYIGWLALSLMLGSRFAYRRKGR